MKVKLAFQLLSRRMACAIKTAGEDPSGLACSPTWKESASFVETLDSVIDACNSYSLRTVDRQKRPSPAANPEIQQRLESFLAWSEQWIIQTKSKDNKPPCFMGYLLPCELS